MNKLTTISDFLEASNTRFRVFDIGRRIVKIDAERFRRFEHGEMAYPQPLQQQAWLAILGWHTEQGDDHFVWFLKFPLDETGRLVQAARDDFLHQLLETAGSSMPQGAEAGMADQLSNSAYGYKPKQETMAAFHAKASALLGLPPSRYFEHARNYLCGETGFEQWAFVGLQGFADAAVRLQDGKLARCITDAIPNLPPAPLQALCGCLEHEAVAHPIAEALASRARRELEESTPDTAVIAACLRGVSGSPATGIRSALLEELLHTPHAASIDLLAAIASRCWEALKNEALALPYIEALAINPAGQEAFNQIVADLMFIPGMRQPILGALRNPERSAALTAAVEKMFKHSLR